MTRIYDAPSKPEDVIYINSDRVTKEWGNQWRDAVIDKIREFPNHNRTFFVGSTPVAIGGIVPLLRGSGEAYTIIDNVALNMPAMPRAVLKVSWELQIYLDLYRLQATARADDEELLDRWLTYQGFTYECTLVGYDQGVDYHIYARFL